MKLKFFLFIFCLPMVGIAQHSFEFGAGWGNMGISPKTTWKPYGWSQGSRKEVNTAFSYRFISEKKLYYAPFASLFYINTWSLTGGMNLVSLNLGLGGMGVYLSKPLSNFSLEERPKKWFATFEINIASVSIGGNITPNYGVRGKNSGKREWTDPYNQIINGVAPNQYYPIKDTYHAINNGHYECFQYSIPITIRVWNMLTQTIGFGMFVSSDVLILEKSLNFKSPWSIGYNIRVGFSLTLFNGKK